MPELTEEQKKLQDGAVALAKGKLGKNMIERDQAEEFDRDGWRACADFGHVRDLRRCRRQLERAGAG